MSKTHTVIIIDDQKSCIDTLQKELASFADFKVINSCTSLTKAKESILNYRPSVIFLDVEMPKMSGFDFLDELHNFIQWPIHIIFYSAFDKYILQAFRSSATDFLLKPFTREELIEVLDHIREKAICNQQFQASNAALSIKNSFSERFAIQTISGISFIKTSDVIYFEKVDNQWQLTLMNGNTFYLRSGVGHKDITQISSSFLLVNPKQIVNINQVAAIENKTSHCIFYPPFQDDNCKIYISRRNLPRIKSYLTCL